MTQEQFEQIVEEEFPRAIPERFRSLIKNVAFLTEGEPSEELRRTQDLADDETLLGFYHGTPAVARGDMYGVGATLPDTISLFQFPIEDEAELLSHGDPVLYEQMLRKVVRETIWHEVAHHFGFDEHQVRDREERRDSESDIV